PCALIRISGVGEAFGNDPAPRGKRGRNHLRDMLAARGKHQKGLGIDIHRLGEDERAQVLAQRRTAGLARDYDVFSAPAQEISHTADVRTLSSTVDAFQGDELAAAHRPERRRAPGIWYLPTARLCSTSVLENSLVPSPRETKYRASVWAGCITASSDASPGIAIGCGGRPSRV